MSYSKHIPKILKEEDITLLTDTILSSDAYNEGILGEFIKWRDITIIQLMFYTGLRPVECLCLKWDDLDFRKRLIYVRPYINKIKNDLPVIMTNPAIKILERFREKADKFKIECQWLFPSVWTWKPLTSHTMSRKFNIICKRAGINKLERRDERGKPCYTIRLYDLRHSFATKIYKKTKSEIAVARLCRHTQLRSADIYTHLDIDDKIEIADEIFS